MNFVILLLGGFLILTFLGIPIAFVMGGLGYLWIFMTGGEGTLIVRRMYYGLDSFPLLAVPLFILAGTLMEQYDLSYKLVKFCNVLMERFRGGLAYTTVLLSMIISGLSGSSQADTAAVGSLLIPSMKKEGYSAEFAAGVTVAATTNGIIIPPSIPMIVLGSTIPVSIAGMFVSGFAVGAFVGLALMLVIFLLSFRYSFPKGQTYSFREFLHATWIATPALVIPILILGGIWAGVFTATEAASVCVVYAIAYAYLSKGLKAQAIWQTTKDVWRVFKESAILSSICLIIVGFGLALGWIMAYENVSVMLTEGITSISSNPTSVLLMIAGIVIIAGCFVDNITIILLLCPIMWPLILKLGIDPLHFAMVIIVGGAIGLITPPMGLCLFVASSLTGLSIERIAWGALPFLIMEIIVYFLIIVFPGISTWLPNLFLS